jgi:hypothetical protein
MAGLIVLSTLILMSVLAPAIERYSPIELNLDAMSNAPSSAHWLGTDTTGRDVWSRIVHAGRVSLSVGLVAVSISTLIGVVIGSLSGYAGGTVDLLLMRFTDMVMTFPSLVMIITVASVLGPSIYNTMIVIGILTWPGIARLVRGRIPVISRAAVCSGRPLDRRAADSDHVPPPLPERNQFGHRGGHVWHGQRHPAGGVAVVPGSGRAGAHSELGQYAAGCPDALDFGGHALALAGARHHDCPGRAQHQLHR